MINVMMQGTKADCLRARDGLVHRLVRQGESTHGYSIRPSAANADCDPCGQWELLEPGATDQVSQAAISAMCMRLVGSEEHGTEAAVPNVAEDARDLIERMAVEMARIREMVRILHTALDEASTSLDDFSARNPDDARPYQGEIDAGKRLLAGTMPPPTAADAFVERVAALKKWDEPDEDGEPFEPSDGLDDSHSCLMDLIDEARGIAAAKE